MRVDIVRQADDLHRETWAFALLADYSERISIRLIRHLVAVRPTLRHLKWQVSPPSWDRWATSRHYDQPIPADVVQEAKDSFVAAIQAATVEVD